MASESVQPDTRGRENRPWEDVDRMLGVDEARERILDAVSPLEPGDIPLLDALGLVLASDVVSTVNIPPFRNSAMDGYAVRSLDTSGASSSQPAQLTVIAELAAGYPSEVTVESGQAVRIMTGAAMPDGADAVVRFEETDEIGPEASRDRRAVQIHIEAKPGENVREAGEDVRAGTTVLKAGTVLRPAEIGVLASINQSRVRAHRRPRVGILSTGDEVIGLGPELRPGQIRDANSYTLAAMVKHYGGEPVVLGVARDTIEDLRTKLSATRGVDLLVTSGGVSLGDYDMVKQVLQAEGEIGLWQVRIKPGKPLAFGRIGTTPLLGLPGNPVAAFVAFEQFGRPALLKMLGRTDWQPLTVKARLLTDQENRGQRRHFVRGILERRGDTYVVGPSGSQGSAVLSSVARANCLIVVPESWEYAEAGSIVDVQLLDTDWAI
jgi:molybdopterin molybdotransferase